MSKQGKTITGAQERRSVTLLCQQLAFRSAWPWSHLWAVSTENTAHHIDLGCLAVSLGSCVCNHLISFVFYFGCKVFSGAASLYCICKPQLLQLWKFLLWRLPHLIFLPNRCQALLFIVQGGWHCLHTAVYRCPCEKTWYYNVSSA